MSGFYLLKPSWSINASATSSNEENSNVSASNLFNSQPSYKYQSSNLTTVQITLDGGTALPWNALSLISHNGSASGSLRVTTHSSTGALFSDPTYEKTVPLRFDGDWSHLTYWDTFVLINNTQTLRYIGLEILDSSNSDGYFTAGVCQVGMVFEPRIGADIGSSLHPFDPSEIQRLTNGEANVRAKRIYDIGTFRFPKQPAIDTNEWRMIQKIYGSSTPMTLFWEASQANYYQSTLSYGYAQWRQGGAVVYANPDGLHDVEMGWESI